MSCKELIGAAAMVLGLSASLCSAADLSDSASADDWSGPYAGIHAGTGKADADLQFDATTGFVGSDIEDGFSTSLEGRLAGGQVGYNWQKDNFVFGVEADATWSGVEGGYRNEYLGGNYHFQADVDVNWLTSLRARAGYVMPKTVIYGTGGVAFSRMDTKAASDYAGYPLPYISDSGSATHSGWVLGGGIETKISTNVTARLEYLHYDFGGESFFYRFDPESDAYDAFGDAYLDVDILRVGVNVRF